MFLFASSVLAVFLLDAVQVPGDAKFLGEGCKILCQGRVHPELLGLIASFKAPEGIWGIIRD